VASNPATLGKTGKYGDLKRRLAFCCWRSSSTGSARTSRCRASTPTAAPAVQLAAGRHPRSVHMFSGGALSRFFGLRARDHAVHLGVDHLPDVDLRAAVLESMRKEGEAVGGRSRSTRANARSAWRWCSPTASRWPCSRSRAGAQSRLHVRLHLHGFARHARYS